MKIKELRSRVQIRPFRPLNIHLSDGRLLKVPHLDYLLFLPPVAGDIFIVVDRGGAFHIVNAKLVTDVEYKKNGS